MTIYLLNKKRIFITIFILFNIITLQARNCNYRVFNIKVTKRVSSLDILNQLSNECDFSIIALDKVAHDKLNEKLYGINIHKLSLKKIFDLLISSKGLRYRYNEQVLKISGLLTRTFKIDYISTTRMGSSSTDISMNGDTQESSLTTSENNTNNSYSNTSQGSSQTTGATISSKDSFNFWSTIQKELHSILNSPLDRFKAPEPIINKEAGLITVSGTASQIRRISSYLSELMKRLHRQVMIDVQILSVRLDGSKSTGVDWSQLYKLQNVAINYEMLKTKGVSKIDTDSITEWGDIPAENAKFIKINGGISVQSIIDFLHTQGDVSSISNPKVTTLNNQPAIFSSGEQLYYKILQSVSQVSTGGSSTGQNEVVRSVFAGVLLDITPEITDNNEIILKINPSISSINSSPSTNNGVRTIPPDLKKQQMSSVVKLKDGQRIILGGLISKVKSITVKKVPILGNIPIIGNAFRKKIKTNIKEELIIIITPHIVRHSREISLKRLGYNESF